MKSFYEHVVYFVMAVVVAAVFWKVAFWDDTVKLLFFSLVFLCACFYPLMILNADILYSSWHKYQLNLFSTNLCILLSHHLGHLLPDFNHMPNITSCLFLAYKHVHIETFLNL
jgi:hypothetical protein